MLTHAELATRIESLVGTDLVAYWTSAGVITQMEAILKKMSRRVPYVTSQRHPSDRAVPIRGEYTTDGTTRDIVLTDWDSDDTVKIAQLDGVEYLVDKSPKEYINHTRSGKIVTLAVDAIPTASLSVYIYPQRLHILQAAIGTTDTAGVVTAAIAATSLALTSLGTGTINKYTKLVITGDTTEYMVKATVTIADAAATVAITPPLVAAATGKVVTLSLNDSTLTPDLEEILVDWTSGELMKGYAPDVMGGMNTGSSPKDYISIGQERITGALTDLRMHETPDRYVRHPRS